MEAEAYVSPHIGLTIGSCCYWLPETRQMCVCASLPGKTVWPWNKYGEVSYLFILVCHSITLEYMKCSYWRDHFRYKSLQPRYQCRGTMCWSKRRLLVTQSQDAEAAHLIPCSHSYARPDMVVPGKGRRASITLIALSIVGGLLCVSELNMCIAYAADFSS